MKRRAKLLSRRTTSLSLLRIVKPEPQSVTLGLVTPGHSTIQQSNLFCWQSAGQLVPHLGMRHQQARVDDLKSDLGVQFCCFLILWRLEHAPPKGV